MQRFRSSTTIFASANPLSGDWQDDMVDLNQINVIQPLLDRFDLKFILKRNKDQDKIREYASLKSKFLVTDSKDPLQKEIESSNTKFLQKYLMYAKQKFDPEITPEAESMISEYYVKVAANSPISSRALETIYNLTIARAKLKLKDQVDSNDAKETINFYNKVTEDYYSKVTETEDPKDLAVRLILEELEDYSKSPILSVSNTDVEFYSLCESACAKNHQVRLYLGDKLNMNVNRKVRTIAETLQEHPHVRRVNERPLTLIWT